MSHRDQHHDADYFEAYVRESEVILTMIGRKTDSAAAVRALIGRLYLISASYSMGADRPKICEMVRTLYQEIPEALAERPLSIGDAIPLAALGYLCEVEDLTAKLHRFMVLPVDPSSRNRIVDLLLGDESALDTGLYTGRDPAPALSEHFWAVADSARAGSQDASDLLVSFVRTHWYRSWKAAPWWGAHKNDVHMVYKGYWCFEGAALAKMFDLDDSPLKDHKYYPYDLVHE